MGKFWDKLSQEHSKIVDENFRRTVANRYFVNPHFDNEEDLKRLHHMAFMQGVNMDYRDELIGNPNFVKIDDRIITQDLITTAGEISHIKECIDFNEIKSIVEFGAGWGRFPYFLLQKYPHIDYTIIDIEPALSIAKGVLGDRVKYLTPKDKISKADLGLFISVLSELSEEEYKHYRYEFRNFDWVYIKDWTKWTNPDDGWTFTKEMLPRDRVVDRKDLIMDYFFEIIIKNKI